MTSSPQFNAVELPPQLVADHKALDHAIAKAKRTRAAVEEAAAQIPVLEAEVQELTAKLAEKDADRAIADDAEVKALDAEIKKIASDVDSKQRSLNRARNAVQVLEARAPEHDAELRDAAVAAENDIRVLAGNLMEQLRAQLLEQVKPLQGVLAALRAVAPIAPQVREYTAAVCLPDLKGFAGTQQHFGMVFGVNLLAEEPDVEHGRLAAAITEALCPIRASLAAAKSLGAFVPLAKRPKPYVRKSWTNDGVTGEKRAAAEAAQSEAAHARRSQITGPNDRQPPGFKARARTGRVGDLPLGTPVDGEIGHQLVNNMMRNGSGSGSEFAV